MELKGSSLHLQDTPPYLFLSWTPSIQSLPSHPVYWISVLILSCHRCFGLLSGLSTKFLYARLLSPMCRMPHPSHSSWFDHLNGMANRNQWNEFKHAVPLTLSEAGVPLHLSVLCTCTERDERGWGSLRSLLSCEHHYIKFGNCHLCFSFFTFSWHQNFIMFFHYSIFMFVQ